MGNAYIMVVFGILLAKGLGFYRDMVFAKVFGTGVMADIYFQVFGLVNLIFTGIGVALSTLVIKNMNKAENAGREKAYAAYFIKTTLMYLVLAAGIMAVCAPWIVNIILPGLEAAEHIVAVKLMYVMIPSLIFVVIAYIISGILQNERVFFITAIMSLPFNVIIILALAFPGISVFTIGVVTTIGWFLHILILLPAFYKKDYRLLKNSENTLKGNGRNYEIFLIFISNMMFQLCFYTDRAFVSGSEGMAATFNYASNLFITIASVFVVAMSTVVFPSVSKNYEEGNIDYVNDLIRYIITIMAAIFLPFLLVVGLFGPDVIRLVYERGSFTADSTMAVSVFFFIYSLGILGYVSQELFNKVLYLAGKYKYSVIGTIVVVLLNVVINVIIRLLLPDFKAGISLYSSAPFWISSITSVLLTGYAVVTAIGIKKVVGPYFKKELISNVIKIFIAGGCAVLVYLGFNIFAPDFTHGYITFIVPLLSCGIIYLILLAITGVLKHLVKKI